MKTALTSLLLATLLGFALLASGRLIDTADFAVILFTTGLVAWTIVQYSRTPRALGFTRSVRLPVAPAARPARRSAARLAA